MSRKISIVTAVLLLVLAGIIYTWKEINRKNESLLHVNPVTEINASKLIAEYSENDSVADERYIGKVISVTGVVKQVDRDDEGNVTVVIGDSTEMSSVRCAMDASALKTAEGLGKGDPVTIKGELTGFDRDDTGLLGSDIKLARCVIVGPKKK